MKKLLLAFILVVAFQISQANIFIPPGAEISELLWDENGDWQLEISYYSIGAEGVLYDSVVISTNNFRYKLSLPLLDSFTQGLIVLNKTIVGDSLDILQEGDSIYLQTYAEEWAFNSPIHQLVFGNYTNANIPKPNAGESIISVEGFSRRFVISPNPTLGESNTLVGVVGTISGKIVDAENNPVFANPSFGLDFSFKLDASGNYSTKLLKGDRKYSKIAFDVYYEDYFLWYTIEPIELTIEPDQTYENIDIKITDPTFVGIEDQTVKKQFNIYPNPTSNQLTIESQTENSLELVEIIIYNMAGKKVAKYKKNNGKIISINLNNKLISGLYLVEIWEQGQLKHSERLVINAFK
jgi:hypothetical protein